MAGYYRLRPEDLLPSDRELELMKTAQGAPGMGESIGSLVGTGLGAGASLLSGGVIPAPLAMSLGGLGGKLIGGGIGGMVAEGPEEELAKLQQEREEKITAQRMRDQALRNLLGTA